MQSTYFKNRQNSYNNGSLRKGHTTWIPTPLSKKKYRNLLAWAHSKKWFFRVSKRGKHVFLTNWKVVMRVKARKDLLEDKKWIWFCCIHLLFKNIIFNNTMQSIQKIAELFEISQRWKTETNGIYPSRTKTRYDIFLHFIKQQKALGK